MSPYTGSRALPKPAKKARRLAAIVRPSRGLRRFKIGRSALFVALALIGGSGACSESRESSRTIDLPPSEPIAKAPSEAESACPAELPAPPSLPGIRDEHKTLEYWLERTAEVTDLDAPVLDPGAIAEHNRLIQGESSGGVRHDLLAPVEPQSILDSVERRLSFLHGRVLSGKYVNAEGKALSSEEIQALAPIGRLPTLHPELRVALAPLPMLCGPRLQGLYTTSLDLAFDRNLCSMIRAQEPIQVLIPWSDDLLLVRTGYVIGWIARSSAALSPKLRSKSEQRLFVRGPWMVASRNTELRSESGEILRLPFGGRVPRVVRGRGEVWAATERGVVKASPTASEALVPTGRPLTRRQFLTAAFAYRGRPYGWGGYHEGRDCSRFLMDLFAGFGVDLPRHSSDQAVAGQVIEIGPGLAEEERLRIIDRAHRRGLVLLHFPNHIMLYLGRDAGGVPMVLHSFAEYLVPCTGRTAEMPAGERESLVHVDRIQISDLELGRGSSRTAFIERITKVTVIGRVATPESEPEPGPTAD
ncbi:MAG TPA: hypothetical protein ENK31_09755 [Nannocystis exedens]|nr:hypothetical protein [Nannocystis exedens]